MDTQEQLPPANLLTVPQMRELLTSNNRSVKGLQKRLQVVKAYQSLVDAGTENIEQSIEADNVQVEAVPTQNGGNLADQVAQLARNTAADTPSVGKDGVTMTSVLAELRTLQQTVQMLLTMQQTSTATTTAATTTAVATTSVIPARPSNITGSTIVPSPTPIGTATTNTTYNLTTVSQASGSCDPRGIGSGIASHSLPYMDIVSPTMRKNIIEGKDINLALLLLPSGEAGRDGQDKVIQVDGRDIVIKPTTSDLRTTRPLSLNEFLVAFGKYRNVLCEVYPHRREELDIYLREIVDMATRFGGTHFYEYHKQFSARASLVLAQRNVLIDWSIRDYILFGNVFNGLKSSLCGLCGSIGHTTAMCTPQANAATAKPVTTLSSPPWNNHPYTRPNGYQERNQEKSPTCRDYNNTTCSRLQCRFAHSCNRCGANHPAAKCSYK
jgi:hypothetical protein